MKLLNRTIRSYLVYSGILVLIAVPIFYFVIQSIVYEEVDEGLVAEKSEILRHPAQLPADDSTWESKASGVKLRPSASLLLRDSFYNNVLFDTISHEQIPYRVIESGFLIGKKPYILTLQRSLIDTQELIRSIVMVMIILLLLIVTGFLVINRVISKKIWKPFYHAVNTLHAYELEKNELPVFEKTGIDEFRDLNNSIGTLIERNLAVFQSQKEFTENAAHEMQTPLAILQGKLELLMQTEPLNAGQANLISDLADASQRMNRLNRSLLLLTKIENKQFIDKEKISLNDSLRKTIDQLSVLAAEKNISIQFSPGEDIFVQTNRSLLEILIGNLLSNAIRHSPGGGSVAVATDTTPALRISNTANTGALDPDRIFQRFQKDSPDKNSTGLGLAIARRICTLYQFSLGYHFTGGMHVFTVKF